VKEQSVNDVPTCLTCADLGYWVDSAGRHPCRCPAGHHWRIDPPVENKRYSTETESDEWWTAFVAYWTERGADRVEIEKAVLAFRSAQSSLTAALRQRQ
jgi:hypothetical protein